MSDSVIERVLDRFTVVRKRGDTYDVLCPVHGDRVSSMTISIGDSGGVVMHCQRGCETADILHATGLTFADLMGEPFLVRDYVYTDEMGNELFRIERWANPKDFRIRPAGLPVAQRTLYARPWISFARANGLPIVVVEGEKDCETLLARGIAATTNPFGAGKWEKHYCELLRDLHVICVADNDDAGFAHMRLVAAMLDGVALSVSVMRPMYGNDVTEMYEAGFDIEHIEAVADESPLGRFQASKIKRGKLKWAWEGWIPQGMLSIVEAPPGLGKSTLTCDLVARWSTGAAMPDGTNHFGPVGCVMISAEDDPGVTVVPRLIAAGADLDNVWLITHGSTPDAPFSMGTDMAALQWTVLETRAKVVVLDPLMAFLPARVNGHVDTEVRKALYPLTLMARSLGITVVTVRHHVKNAKDAASAGMGSVGIGGVARSVITIKPDPLNRGSFVMASQKLNVGKHPKAWAYSVVEDPGQQIGRIAWHGPTDWDTDELFAGEAGASDHEAAIRAADWLTDLLDGTFDTWKSIYTKGQANGFSKRVLQRARGSVLTHVINPPFGGEIVLGTYWVRIDQRNTIFGSSQSATTASVPTGTGYAQPVPMGTDTTVTESDENPPEQDRDAELMAKPEICDICGNTTAMRLFEPFWVIRCKAHHPLTYRGGDPPGEPPPT